MVCYLDNHSNLGPCFMGLARQTTRTKHSNCFSVGRHRLCNIRHECDMSHAWGCRAVSSRRLVPGDVLVLLRGKATCDMVLLTGNCLVEESMLSGEVRLHFACRP